MDEILRRAEFCNGALFGGDYFKSPVRSYGAIESPKPKWNVVVDPNHIPRIPAGPKD
jgi:hypothetical protein